MVVKLLNVGVLFVTANQHMKASVRALTPRCLRRQRHWVPADFLVSPYVAPSLLPLQP